MGVVGVTLFTLIGWGMWRLSQPDYEFSNGRSLADNISGRWGWSTKSIPCAADSGHTIAFSSDGKVMTITQDELSVDDDGRDWTVTTYDVVSTTASRVRGAIRGETRVTDDGRPVVWDLVVIDSNAYVWHRTDWPASGYTARVIRCQARDVDLDA